MSNRIRLAALGGYLAPVLSAIAILGAALLDGDFSIASQALSDLGVTPASAPVFNLGLIAAGIVGLPFGLALWWTAQSVFERTGAAVFVVATLCLAGVGAFPSDTGLHAPAAIGFFVAFTYAMFLIGTGQIRRGAIDRGLVVLWLGIGHVTAWLVWAGSGVTSGLALPELAGSVLLAIWTVTGANRLRQQRKPSA